MPNRFTDRLKVPDRKPPSQADEITNGIVKAVLLLIVVGFLIYLGMHYYF